MPSTAKTPSRSEPARGLFGDLLEAVASGLDAAAATEESLTADLEALEPSQETERDPSPEPGTTSSAPEKSVEPTAQAQPPPSITIPSRKRPTRSSKAVAAEPTMDLSQGGDEELDEASKSVPKAKKAPRTAQATVNQQLSDDVASLRAEIQSLQANIGVVSSNVEHTQAQIMDVRALVNDATSAASDLRDALSLVREDRKCRFCRIEVESPEHVLLACRGNGDVLRLRAKFLEALLRQGSREEHEALRGVDMNPRAQLKIIVFGMPGIVAQTAKYVSEIENIIRRTEYVQ